MEERLFVYGTLGPGRPNEHIMEAVGGTWERATVRGYLRQQGWGARMGYPGIELDESGDQVEGFVFTSMNLEHHWETLDEFEGDGYQRVLARVRTASGRIVEAAVYQLCPKNQTRDLPSGGSYPGLMRPDLEQAVEHNTDT